MGNIAVATLTDNRKLQYVIEDHPPRGNMKYTYFAPDKSYVVQFYNRRDAGNCPNMTSRLERIISRYNPTLPEERGGAIGNSEKTAAYFARHFCWPMSIVKHPEFGIVCPTYPSNFFFGAHASDVLSLKGKEKKSNWFTSNKNRKYLRKEELGNFKTMLQISLLLARTIRRMHTAGLAHSDLSNNNVLIDPKTGDCVVIDIDSLVVPGMFLPEVAGSRGYVAPEVLATMYMSEEKRKFPSRYTDLHALAVLIYQYIFFRHPLLGPKIYSAESAEDDDFLALGERATFIENPVDASNRPGSLQGTIGGLGSALKELFLRAFVVGLRSPEDRPSALEWEQALTKARDLVVPCDNPACEHQFFILCDLQRPVCPFCGTRLKGREILRFTFQRESRAQSGQWSPAGEMIVAGHTPLYKWHVFSNVSPDEKADDIAQAYVLRHEGKWLLVNQALDGMLSPSGNAVLPGQATHLRDGAKFRFTNRAGAMAVEVEIRTL